MSEFGERPSSSLREYVGALFSKPEQKVSLPPETRHDEAHHLLCSENFGKTPEAVILFTGFPEGPNELAHSNNSNLSELFGKAGEQTAIAQVYIGPDWRDLINRKRLRRNLHFALEQAGDCQIKLVVLSAGALSLERELPEEYRRKIVSLTFFSPLAGTVSVRGQLAKKATLLVFPSPEKYQDALSPLANRLLLEGKPFELILGKRDNFVDSEAVARSFERRFPKIRITIKNRGHAPTPQEIIEVMGLT